MTRSRSRSGSIVRAAGAAALSLLSVTTLVAVAPSAVASADAAPTLASIPGGRSTLRLHRTDATGFVPARAGGASRLSTAHSSFVVTYHGFPANAKASFQRAVDLWSLLIDSDVPIRIDATWSAMPPGVLGGAGPAEYYRDFPGAPRSGTWYPVALANSLAGIDVSGDVDIYAEFASGISDWYLGTDGQVPVNKIDFTSVVLHEIGHGLGLVDSTELTGSTGSWGGGSGYPFIYDRLAQAADGTPLSSFVTGTALGSVLRSNAVAWGGTFAKAANGGNRPRLYSPNPFQVGSSIAHLDEDLFPTGTADALMTPYLDDGEALHDPGDIGLGLLRDLGWGATGPKGVPDKPTLSTALGGNARAILAWKAPVDIGRQLLTGYRVYRYPNGAASPDATYDVGPTTLSTSITGLANGTGYRFTVAARNASGAGAQTAKSATIVPADLGPFTRTDTFVRQQFQDFLGRAPTAAEELTWLDLLHSGARTPSAAIGGIASLAPSHDPSVRITRLYSAYFQRLPDFGGYTYWTGKLRSGTSLKKASDTFAASSEFTTKYGSLSNTAFVNLVYQNVLGRAPDAAGRTYWVGKLTKATVSRGSVMLNFSESSENTRKTESRVTSVLLRAGMVRRMPSMLELSADIALLDGVAVSADLADQILQSTEYDTRIP